MVPLWPKRSGVQGCAAGSLRELAGRACRSDGRRRIFYRDAVQLVLVQVYYTTGKRCCQILYQLYQFAVNLVGRWRETVRGNEDTGRGDSLRARRLDFCVRAGSAVVAARPDPPRFRPVPSPWTSRRRRSLSRRPRCRPRPSAGRAGLRWAGRPGGASSVSAGQAPDADPPASDPSPNERDPPEPAGRTRPRPAARRRARRARAGGRARGCRSAGGAPSRPRRPSPPADAPAKSRRGRPGAVPRARRWPKRRRHPLVRRPRVPVAPVVPSCTARSGRGVGRSARASKSLRSPSIAFCSLEQQRVDLGCTSLTMPSTRGRARSRASCTFGLMSSSAESIFESSSWNMLFSLGRSSRSAASRRAPISSRGSRLRPASSPAPADVPAPASCASDADPSLPPGAARRPRAAGAAAAPGAAGVVARAARPAAGVPRPRVGRAAGRARRAGAAGLVDG